MLTFRDVTLSYPLRGKIFNSLNLHISPGERVVIAGRSGSGKTTLLRLAAGLIEPDAGQVDHEGAWPVGFVRQQPENQLIAGTVSEEVAFALEYAGFTSDEITSRVEETLAATGLTELADRSPVRLSGGQMQRVAIAAALAMKPPLWLLDEPTAYLDADGRKRVHSLISSVPGTSTLLYATSDPEELTLGDRLVVLAEGRVAADGVPEKLFEKGVLEELGLYPPRKWTLARRMVPAAPQKAPVSSGNLPEESSKPVRALHSAESQPKTLVATDLHATRREFLGPEREALKKVSLRVEPGEIVALVGPGGAGKSSLLEALAGLLEIDGGSVLWGDLSPDKLSGNIGITFQFPERSFFAESILAEISYGPKKRGLENPEQRAIEALSLLGLPNNGEFLKRSPFELAGGEARRVALSAVAALAPDYWLVDEPTAGLDVVDAAAVGRLIRQEAERGCIVIVAGHDVDRFADWTTRWVVLDDGQVRFDGDPRAAWAEGGLPGYERVPATVQAWRDAGRDVRKMPTMEYREVSKLLAGNS